MQKGARPSPDTAPLWSTIRLSIFYNLTAPSKRVSPSPENIGRKYQRVSRSINYHKFASYTIVGVLQIIIKTEKS
jgi:hypothetical protein